MKRSHSSNKIVHCVSSRLQIALCMTNKYAIVRLMAYSGDSPISSGNAPCMHPRLILETSTKNRYLTGHYVCEQCGQHFDRPPLKQDPPMEQDSPPTP